VVLGRGRQRPDGTQSLGSCGSDTVAREACADSAATPGRVHGRGTQERIGTMALVSQHTDDLAGGAGGDHVLLAELFLEPVNRKSGAMEQVTDGRQVIEAGRPDQHGRVATRRSGTMSAFGPA